MDPHGAARGSTIPAKGARIESGRSFHVWEVERQGGDVLAMTALARKDEGRAAAYVSGRAP